MSLLTCTLPPMKRLLEVANQLDGHAAAIRREAALELRRQGKSFAEIAQLLGISRSRAFQLCQEKKSA